MGRNGEVLNAHDELLEEAMTDCYGRFFATLSDELLSDKVHLYFQIQNAYWWYADHWQENSGGLLPKMRINEFGEKCVNECGILRETIGPSEHRRLLTEWRAYKMAIPIRGAIMLDPTYEYCLLAETYEGNTFMFPRGKMDQGEEDTECAVREVWEELGIDIRKAIDERFFIEKTIDRQNVKLFVIPGISKDVKFDPQTRKETRSIKWMKLTHLPKTPADDPGDGKKFAESIAYLNGKEKLWQVAQFVGHAIYWGALFTKLPNGPPFDDAPHVRPLVLPLALTPPALNIFQRAPLETLDLLFKPHDA